MIRYIYKGKLHSFIDGIDVTIELIFKLIVIKKFLFEIVIAQ